MVDQINMSLDDIIKANRKSTRGGGGVGREFKPGRGRGGAGGGGFRNEWNSRNRGGITKSTSYKRGNVNSAWKYGMFNDFGKRNIWCKTIPGIINIPTKLLVSNLDYGVSDYDIQKLFSEFGILKSAAVHYDRYGRSLGTAVVTFESKSDALRAMMKYDTMRLHGRVIDIQLATSEYTAFRSEERLYGRQQWC